MKMYNERNELITKEEWYKRRAAEGAFGEQMIINHFISKGYEITQSSSTQSNWDIKVKKDGIEKSYEIKTNFNEYLKDEIHPLTVTEVATDIWDPITRKMITKPSGISVSQADYWIIYYPFENIFYIEETKIVKTYMSYGIRKRGGRDNNAILRLVSREHFKNKKDLSFMDYYDDNMTKEHWWDWYKNK
jgi:hypothetical protein